MSELVRTVSRTDLHDQEADSTFWRSRPPAERVAAVEELRCRHHGWDDAARPNSRELFAALNAREVRYLVVGGYALAAHGHPRHTGDLDVWVDASAENAAAEHATWPTSRSSVTRGQT